MKASTMLFIEMYKRKLFASIPISMELGKLYYLSPKQLQALEYLHDETTDSVGYGGSARSGKSLLECFWVTFQCLAYPKVKYAIGRKELNVLMQTVGETLFKLFAFYGIEKEKDFRFNGQTHTIEFNNGSKIIFKDLAYKPTDPLFTSLGGLELTGGCIDESNECREDAVGTFASRCGWWMNNEYGIKKKTLETFNPDKSHVHRRYWKPFKDNKEILERKFIRALPSDNPHPSVRPWIESVIAEGNKIRIQRLIYGEFDYDDDDNALINFDNITNIFTNNFVQPNGYMVMSCDIALSNDAFVIVVWDGFVIKEIVKINKIDSKELVNLLQSTSEKWKVPRTNIVYDADGIGAYIEGYFHGAIGINNNHRPSRPDYMNLKSELYFMLAKFINENKIYIESVSQSIRELVIEELQCVKMETNTEKLSIIKKAKVKELIGHSPDISDALAYRMLIYLLKSK